ncbi:MAG: hypothetical protein R3338_08005, partial [Thermoanaerobaculia bacterium]|nr:hypothetical protein [Thermoanaerobaculia bacterium]
RRDGGLRRMKPLHLNLASRPWQNTRPFWITVAVAIIVISILLVNNAQAAWRYYMETEETRAEIAEIRSRAELESEHAERLQEQVESLDRHNLLTRVEFVNRQIAERAFSWSTLMDHLEKVLPNDVRLTSLRPTVDEDGPVSLAMTCVAKNQQAYVETIRRITADPHFRNPYPLSESSDAGELRFTLRVTYQPSLAEGAELR